MSGVQFVGGGAPLPPGSARCRFDSSASFSVSDPRTTDPRAPPPPPPQPPSPTSLALLTPQPPLALRSDMEKCAPLNGDEIATLWKEYHADKSESIGWVGEGAVGKIVLHKARSKNCKFFVAPVFDSRAEDPATAGYYNLIVQFFEPSHFVLADLNQCVRERAGSSAGEAVGRAGGCREGDPPNPSPSARERSERRQKDGLAPTLFAGDPLERPPRLRSGASAETETALAAACSRR